MSPKKSQKQKNVILENIKSLVPKAPKNLDINPFGLIENTKKKVEKYYIDLKKRKEKEKNR